LNSSKYPQSDTYGIEDEYASQIDPFNPKWWIEVCGYQLLCELYNFM
jgi:hypothetical protein